jgi:hypothetical protein
MTNTTTTEILVKLVSAESQTFELPLSAAKHSLFVRDALNINEHGEVEQGDDDDDDEDANEEEENPEDAGGNTGENGRRSSPRELKPVDCLRVEAACLEKVVEFLKHYEAEKMIEIPVPLPANTFEEVRCLFVTLAYNCIHTRHVVNTRCSNKSKRQQPLLVDTLPLTLVMIYCFSLPVFVQTTTVHDAGMVPTVRVGHRSRSALSSLDGSQLHEH